MKKTLIFAAIAIVAGAIATLVVRREPSELAQLSNVPTATHRPTVAGPASDLSELQAKAAQGDAQAQTRLGKAFATGDGVQIDYAQAAHWHALAAAQGNADAEAALGELYQAGQGVGRNLSNAVALFTKAAEAGNVAGQYDLAFSYEQGLGVPLSKTLSAKWYLAASEGGDPTAQYDYGQRCFMGVGVAKDPVEGMKWLLIADRLGQPDAAGKLATLQQGMSPQDIAEATRRAAAFKPRPPRIVTK